MRTRAFRSVVLRRRDPARRVFTVSGRWEGMMVSVGLESGTSGGGMVWCEGLESGTSRGGGCFGARNWSVVLVTVSGGVWLGSE